MKRNDIALLIIVGVFTAIIAFVFSTLIFKIPSNRATKVPVAGSLNAAFPDIRHDPVYNTIFNNNALDPAVPLQVGSNNDQPFNGAH